MTDPAAATRPTRSRWRNPVFTLTFAFWACVWICFVGWVTWRSYHPIVNWIDRQNEFLQELLPTLLSVVWAGFLGIGMGIAAVLTEWITGIRRTPNWQKHGHHAKWHRP
jgi:Kef-type K+ transport system membrane component KefB